MEFIEVESSNIGAVKYEGNTLYVRFKTGAVYSYDGVSEELYKQLLNAPSIGKFFAANIKNAYSFNKEE